MKREIQAIEMRIKMASCKDRTQEAIALEDSSKFSKIPNSQWREALSEPDNSRPIPTMSQGETTGSVADL